MDEQNGIADFDTYTGRIGCSSSCVVKELTKSRLIIVAFECGGFKIIKMITNIGLIMSYLNWLVDLHEKKI